MARNLLTSRQREVLKFIAQFIDKNKFPPTRSDLVVHFGFRSPNAAEAHLRALEKKSMIGIERGVSRGITLLPLAVGELPARAHAPVPLIGRVAAGSPILAQEHIDQTYLVEASMFPRRPDYLLKVRGMSMRDAGILDGDLLAVQKTREAKNGQIVVARLGDDVTVKRFRRTRSTIELIAENPDFKTIVVPFGDVDFELEGVAVGLVRNTMLM